MLASDLRKEIYKSSLFVTAVDLLGYKDVNKETHGEIIGILESNSKRNLICVPRGCLKSSLACVAYPIWSLIRDPNLRILLDSELYTNSKNFLREIKAHLENPRITDLFGSFKTEPWNEGEITIAKITKSAKEASITAGGIGTQKTGCHYDIIVADDLSSPSNTNSTENTKKVIDHYRMNVSILEPMGEYTIIGTRYSANDIIGHILTNEEHDYQGGLWKAS